MKDPFIGPFEKYPTIIEAAYYHEGFHLVDRVYVMENGELKTIKITPKYPVEFPIVKATFKKCWELRTEESESDDDYRNAMRAHYDRVDPKEEKVYPEISEEYLRPDPYNFYQRKQLCDGYKAIPRFCDNDYARMFVAEHHPGNPQHQTEFDYSDTEEREEIDYLGIPPESKGENKSERVYWIGQVYLVNLRNGRRKEGGAIKFSIGKYFGVSDFTMLKYSKFADACNIVAGKGCGAEVARNNKRPIPNMVRAAAVVSQQEFDWVLKPFDYNKRSKPWETFDGERGYAAKEAALRL